ncbi:crossover junction endodeoxyribonuclease RuvC [bacterium]|nr:MAG: crossover junction endodeoxyribonuclease RuvC [bacterium]
MGEGSPNSAGRTARIVLGVDPGTLVTGYGVISCTRDTLELLDAGTIRNRGEQSMPIRLKRIYEGLQALIDRHHPDEFAIESAFYGKNAQSALKLGQARGVSILAAVEKQIPTTEYSPREVKQAVVGKGTATKEQVQFMVRALLRLQEKAMLLDTSDAIAVAICHLHRARTPSARHKDWSSYIAAHPEKIRP